MNQDLSSLANEAIVDLLAEKTQRFTQMLSEKIVGDEYDDCKKAIQELINEIKTRQGVTISDAKIDFTQPDIT